MTIADQHEAELKEQHNRPPPDRGWPLVLGVVVALTILGWSYLFAMIVAMIPAMDMATAGPGMIIFNQFNLFHGLGQDARAALAVLCLPTGSTFGMPSTTMTVLDLLKIFLMWSMMSLAMMLPTAVPMIRAYRQDLLAKQDHAGIGNTLNAVFGYLAVWQAYAIVATLGQWGLSLLGALSDMMAPVSLALTASVVFAAGIYQFTPSKQACLQRCWYPRWSFGPHRSSPSASTAFREGVAQGLICLGCCWAVMTLMFAVGLMNVIWIALLGSLMALEKTFPSQILPKAIGVFLLAWAAFLIIAIQASRFIG